MVILISGSLLCGSILLLGLGIGLYRVKKRMENENPDNFRSPRKL